MAYQIPDVVSAWARDLVTKWNKLNKPEKYPINHAEPMLYRNGYHYCYLEVVYPFIREGGSYVTGKQIIYQKKPLKFGDVFENAFKWSMWQITCKLHDEAYNVHPIPEIADAILWTPDMMKKVLL